MSAYITFISKEPIVKDAPSVFTCGGYVLQSPTQTIHFDFEHYTYHFQKQEDDRLIISVFLRSLDYDDSLQSKLLTTDFFKKAVFKEICYECYEDEQFKKPILLECSSFHFDYQDQFLTLDYTFHPEQLQEACFLL
jgi:hypothetical protein